MLAWIANVIDMPSQQHPYKRSRRANQASPGTARPKRPNHKAADSIITLPNTTVRKKGNVYFMFHKTRRKFPLRVVIALICVFVGAIGSAYSYAQIHTVQQEIATSRRDLSNQQITNSNLEAQITRSYTREEIEYHASVRLGMGPPDASQIIYFHVPHHSGVLASTYASPIPTATTGFWQSLLDFFRGIRDRFS